MCSDVMEFSRSHNTTWAILLWFYLTFTLCSCRELALKENYFMKVAGYKMDSPDSVISVYTSANADRSVTECGVHCSAVSSCQTFGVSTESHTCVLLSKAVYDMSASWLTDPAWSTWMLVPESVEHNGWTLVFRGTAGIESSMFDIYLDAKNDEINDEPGCLTLGNTLPCHSHFRSPILNDWTNISQVRVSLYKDGVEQKYMVFDGAGSSITSWFSKDKMLQSSWPNLYNTSLEHFDAYGYTTPSSDVIRRFYINAGHYTCPNDIGYLAILEMPVDTCWKVNNATPVPYPWIVYSKTDSYTEWTDGDYGFADVFAVSVKFFQ